MACLAASSSKATGLRLARKNVVSGVRPARALVVRASAEPKVPGLGAEPCNRIQHAVGAVLNA
jgi:hypothetical protein